MSVGISYRGDVASISYRGDVASATLDNLFQGWTAQIVEPAAGNVKAGQDIVVEPAPPFNAGEFSEARVVWFDMAPQPFVAPHLVSTDAAGVHVTRRWHAKALSGGPPLRSGEVAVHALAVFNRSSRANEDRLSGACHGARSSTHATTHGKRKVFWKKATVLRALDGTETVEMPRTMWVYLVERGPDESIIELRDWSQHKLYLGKAPTKVFKLRQGLPNSEGNE